MLVGQLWGMTVLALLLVIISIQLSYLVSSADALVNINIKRNHETAKNNHGSIASLSSSLRRDDHAESHSSDAKQAALLAKLLKGLQCLGPASVYIYIYIYYNHPCFRRTEDPPELCRCMVDG